jgi:hypothetical protein
MELALTHWREKMGSNWQPGISWIKGGEGNAAGKVSMVTVSQDLDEL